MYIKSKQDQTCSELDQTCLKLNSGSYQPPLSERGHYLVYPMPNSTPHARRSKERADISTNELMKLPNSKIQSLNFHPSRGTKLKKSSRTSVEGKL